ncbi:MAG: hypothetical protein ACPGUD_13490 [Parashewanella sp.]
MGTYTATEKAISTDCGIIFHASEKKPSDAFLFGFQVEKKDCNQNFIPKIARVPGSLLGSRFNKGTIEPVEGYAIKASKSAAMATSLFHKSKEIIVYACTSNRAVSLERDYPELSDKTFSTCPLTSSQMILSYDISANHVLGYWNVYLSTVSADSVQYCYSPSFMAFIKNDNTNLSAEDAAIIERISDHWAFVTYNSRTQEFTCEWSEN